MRMKQFRRVLGVAAAATAVGVFGTAVASAEGGGGGGGGPGGGFAGGGGGYVEASQADIQGTDYAHAAPDPESDPGVGYLVPCEFVGGGENGQNCTDPAQDPVAAWDASGGGGN